MVLEGSVRGVGGDRISKRLIVVGIPIAAIAIIALLYFTMPRFRAQIRSLLRIGPQAVAVAPSVAFNLVPQEVKPNTAFNIQGQFQDEQGRPVTVQQGYYYVFETDAMGNKQALVTQGSLGTNISTFNTVVPTTHWADQTKFAIDVSDQPYSAQQLTSMIKPTGQTALSSAAGGTGYNPLTGSNILVQSVSQV